MQFLKGLAKFFEYLPKLEALVKKAIALYRETKKKWQDDKLKRDLKEGAKQAKETKDTSKLEGIFK